MPKHIPSLKPRQLIRLLERHGCRYLRQGKGDHTLYVRQAPDRKRVVPIDMGQSEFSPAYLIRIFRQFGFTDEEIASVFN